MSRVFMPEVADDLPAGERPMVAVVRAVPRHEEQLAAAEDRKQRIVALFGDDPVAQVIVEGIMEGTRGEDLRALTDLDPTAYQSKRRLILRRIAKLTRKPKP